MINQNTAAASKNWKMRRSQIITFTKTEKLYLTPNYGATKPQLLNHAVMTQAKAL